MEVQVKKCGVGRHEVWGRQVLAWSRHSPSRGCALPGCLASWQGRGLMASEPKGEKEEMRR